ncbi:glycosyltransferase [Actinocorallia sp. A-T 12471]|uniref:glycosyltransferase n=1 Tax=Actinocorallia sp. A-T 12471 TaxID=3089813 RepID=UPI0029D254A2|nr:glycosyltransferase [Actinocorallia sp. A-T 12471]MDX6742518.1 glycosyltransferase [Actinocorallia sp. A-T 12471]
MGRKVVIFAAGSRGDLQPCVALGRGLADRGDEVRLISSESYRGLIEDAGLAFRGLSLDPAKIVDSPEGQELLSGGRNPAKFLRNMKRIAAPLAEKLLAEVDDGTDGADLVLAPTLGYLGAHIAEHRGIPHALIHFQPSQPTGRFPHPFLPHARLLGPYANRLTYEALDFVTWQLTRPFINTWRTERLKLPPVSLLGPQRAARTAPVLCAFSSVLVPRPADWPDNVKLTGFWFLDQPHWEPSPELTAFLDAGPPPVYVGFGSMLPADPRETDLKVRTALRLAGFRGVLQGDPSTSEDDMFVVNNVPHSWLFPRMAAAVHHGGAGTTAESLRAGLPTLVCPFFGDQPYWADRVHALGAGPTPLPIRHLTVESLTSRLRTLPTPPHRTRAQTLASSLNAEDGVARACESLDLLQPLSELSGRQASSRRSGRPILRAQSRAIASPR